MNNIYLITPNKLNKRFYYYLPKVLSTKKIKFLQVRSKKLSKVKLLNHIKKIIPIVKKYNTKLVINDYPELASAFNCGFHLGQRDLKNKLNKQYLAKKKLNLSATTNLRAAIVDANYVVISTPTNYDEKTNLY